MFSENKIVNLAKTIISHSCSLEKGEKVLIEAIDVPFSFLEILIDEIYKIGANPFLIIKSERIIRALALGMKENQIKIQAENEKQLIEQMDAFIGIRNVLNIFELSDVPKDKLKLIREQYIKPVHYEVKNKKTKWVHLRWPSQSMAQKANMSFEKFKNYYFNACLVNYKELDKKMDDLCDLINKTDNVHIKGPGKTDLKFSIKGIDVMKSSGKFNLPDGEVFTAPVKDSVNGEIGFNISSIYQANEFQNVWLKFHNGKIIEVKCDNNQERLSNLFEQDDGAKYVGEFAFGLNPVIREPIREIVFDEKINTSIHLAIGNSYKQAFNGNVSGIHIDLILDQDSSKGGGEIYFDNILIRKNGKFVISQLKELNAKTTL